MSGLDIGGGARFENKIQLGTIFIYIYISVTNVDITKLQRHTYNIVSCIY